MKTPQLYRQGDVLLMRVVSKPQHKLTPVTPKNGRVVLALGETSNHMHSIASEHCQEFVDDAGVTWLECRQAVELLHHTPGLKPTGEHDPISALPKGWFKRLPQCEYSPAEIRRVLD